jgi:hypothetical protein
MEYPGAMYRVIQENTAAGRARFEQWLEQRRLKKTDPEALKALRRG